MVYQNESVKNWNVKLAGGKVNITVNDLNHDEKLQVLEVFKNIETCVKGFIDSKPPGTSFWLQPNSNILI